jgi:hypothetical protein
MNLRTAVVACGWGQFDANHAPPSYRTSFHHALKTVACANVNKNVHDWLASRSRWIARESRGPGRLDRSLLSALWIGADVGPGRLTGYAIGVTIAVDANDQPSVIVSESGIAMNTGGSGTTSCAVTGEPTMAPSESFA